MIAWVTPGLTISRETCTEISNVLALRAQGMAVSRLDTAFTDYLQRLQTGNVPGGREQGLTVLGEWTAQVQCSARLRRRGRRLGDWNSTV